MLISHTHRFVFTKTKKTGSSSVASYFEPLCMRPGEWVQSDNRPEYESETGAIGFRGPEYKTTEWRWWNHMPAKMIRQRLGAERWDSYFKFCVVRNPYDKAISAYFFFTSIHHPNGLPAATDHRERFEEWLQSGELPIDRNIYTIDGQLAVDRVVRYESLVSDLPEVCQRLGVPWQPERLARFKSGIRPIEATPDRLYTDRARRLVEQAYAFELAHFGYSFPCSRAA
jgi:hypothetical protein